MGLEFKVYERSTEALQVLGTVGSQIGKKGQVRFVPNTFNSGKRIAVILTNEQNESTVVACSLRVSDAIKEAKEKGATEEVLASAVVNLEISEDDNGRNFIIAPTGEATTGFIVEALEAKAVNWNKLTTLTDASIKALLEASI